MRKLPDPAPDTPSLATLEEIFTRLRVDQKARWGKMNATQMTRHCAQFIDLYLGRVPVAFPIRMIARAIGPFFLRRVLAKSPLETPRNLSTLPALRVDEDATLQHATERDRLLEGFREVSRLSGTISHPLYGATEAADIQNLVRHHTAHHANQFGLME